MKLSRIDHRSIEEQWVRARHLYTQFRESRFADGSINHGSGCLKCREPTLEEAQREGIEGETCTRVVNGVRMVVMDAGELVSMVRYVIGAVGVDYQPYRYEFQAENLAEALARVLRNEEAGEADTEDDLFSLGCHANLYKVQIAYPDGSLGAVDPREVWQANAELAEPKYKDVRPFIGYHGPMNSVPEKFKGILRQSIPELPPEPEVQPAPLVGTKKEVPAPVMPAASSAWVPTDVELPKPRQVVLLCTRNGLFVVGCFREQLSGQFGFSDGDGRHILNVTHWSPLSRPGA